MKLQEISFAVPLWAGSLALCAVALGTSGGAGTTTKKSEPPAIQLGPEARDLVRIAEGESFVVPAGRVLVVTSLVAGYADLGNGVVKVDGAPVFGGNLIDGPVQLAVGLPVRAGEVVTVEDAFGPDPLSSYVAVGYLADE